jgi:hypothetical protein
MHKVFFGSPERYTTGTEAVCRPGDARKLLVLHGFGKID